MEFTGHAVIPPKKVVFFFNWGHAFFSLAYEVSGLTFFFWGVGVSRQRFEHSNPSHSNGSHSNPSHSNPSHSNPSHSNPSGYLRKRRGSSQGGGRITTEQMLCTELLGERVVQARAVLGLCPVPPFVFKAERVVFASSQRSLALLSGDDGSTGALAIRHISEAICLATNVSPIFRGQRSNPQHFSSPQNHRPVEANMGVLDTGASSQLLQNDTIIPMGVLCPEPTFPSLPWTDSLTSDQTLCWGGVVGVWKSPVCVFPFPISYPGCGVEDSAITQSTTHPHSMELETAGVELPTETIENPPIAPTAESAILPPHTSDGALPSTTASCILASHLSDGILPATTASCVLPPAPHAPDLTVPSTTADLSLNFLKYRTMEKDLILAHPNVGHLERVALAQAGQAFSQHYAAWLRGLFSEDVHESDWSKCEETMRSTLGPYNIFFLLQMLPAQRSLNLLFSTYISSSFPVMNPAAVAEWLLPRVLSPISCYTRGETCIRWFCSTRVFHFRTRPPIAFPKKPTGLPFVFCLIMHKFCANPMSFGSISFFRSCYNML